MPRPQKNSASRTATAPPVTTTRRVRRRPEVGRRPARPISSVTAARLSFPPSRCMPQRVGAAARPARTRAPAASESWRSSSTARGETREHRRPHLDEVVGHRRGRFGDRDLRARDQRRVQVEHPRRRRRQREHGEVAVALGELEPVGGDLRHRGHGVGLQACRAGVAAAAGAEDHDRRRRRRARRRRRDRARAAGAAARPRSGSRRSVRARRARARASSAARRRARVSTCSWSPQTTTAAPSVGEHARRRVRRRLRRQRHRRRAQRTGSRDRQTTHSGLFSATSATGVARARRRARAARRPQPLTRIASSP